MQTPEKEMKQIAEKMSRELFEASEEGFNAFFEDLMIQLYFSYLYNMSQMSEKRIMEYWREAKKLDFDSLKKGEKNV